MCQQCVETIRKWNNKQRNMYKYVQIMPNVSDISRYWLKGCYVLAISPSAPVRQSSLKCSPRTGEEMLPSGRFQLSKTVSCCYLSNPNIGKSTSKACEAFMHSCSYWIWPPFFSTTVHIPPVWNGSSFRQSQDIPHSPYLICRYIWCLKYFLVFQDCDDQ